MKNILYLYKIIINLFINNYYLINLYCYQDFFKNILIKREKKIYFYKIKVLYSNSINAFSYRLLALFYKKYFLTYLYRSFLNYYYIK